MLYVIFTSIILLASVVLIMLVLAQNSKGGGLAAGFDSGNQFMGVRRTTNFVEKATWGFAAFIVVLCIISSISVASSHESATASQQSALKEEVDNLPSALPVPAAEEAAAPVALPVDEAPAAE